MNEFRAALRRVKIGTISIAATYFVAVAVGMVMAHANNTAALSFRDQLVSKARAHDPSAVADAAGHRSTAALIDLGRNLFLGAIPSTVGGLAIVLPYPVAAYRGWVGGIVSVNGQHVSRLRSTDSAAYYLITLLLQLVPYSLAGGAGIRLGWAYYRPSAADLLRGRWLGLPVAALYDVARVYALIVPLFAVASLWEFLSPLR
jgi:hypothetical protein